MCSKFLATMDGFISSEKVYEANHAKEIVANFEFKMKIVMRTVVVLSLWTKFMKREKAATSITHLFIRRIQAFATCGRDPSMFTEIENEDMALFNSGEARPKPEWM